MGCIERQILAALRHRTFTSLADINAALLPLLATFNSQPFQKMKASRRSLFEAVDQPALKPLPERPYEYALWKQAKINIDYHFVFEDHYYSVPYQHIHHTVDLRATQKTVECFYQGQRIAVHPRDPRRYQFTTLLEHMPRAHRAHAEWTPERIKRWASKIGEHTVLFIDTLIQSRPFPEQAFRSCLGVLRLGTRFGEARLEKACALAYQAGATRYQYVETLLKNKLDLVPSPPAPSSTPSIAHDNVRGSTYYQ